MGVPTTVPPLPKQPRWAFIHPFQLRLRRGIETSLWNLAAALSETGVSVEILTWSGPLGIPEHVQRAGVRIRAAPEVRYYQHHWGCLYYLRHLLASRYDHVFVNFAGYGEGPALEIGRAFQPAPFTLVAHFPRSLASYQYQEFERWRFPEQASHLVAVSSYVARQVEEWCGRKCSVIGHGVDTGRFRFDPEQRRRVRADLGLEASQHLLITVAALEPEKGIQRVIGVMPKVLSAFPNTHYCVLGEGEHRRDLEQLIRSRRLESHISLLGSVENVEHYLSAADVAVLLSDDEAYGVSLLECAASRLPVVAPRRPPFDELIRPESGCLVDEMDSEHVFRTIAGLLASPERRLRLGQAGRAIVEAHHSWQQVAAQYRALIA